MFPWYVWLFFAAVAAGAYWFILSLCAIAAAADEKANGGWYSTSDTPIPFSLTPEGEKVTAALTDGTERR